MYVRFQLSDQFDPNKSPAESAGVGEGSRRGKKRARGVDNDDGSGENDVEDDPRRLGSGAEDDVGNEWMDADDVVLMEEDDKVWG